MLAAAAHQPTRPAAPIVDIHNHLGLRPPGGWWADDPAALVAIMDEARVQTIVNLDGRWGDELEQNLDRYDRAHPGRYLTFARLDWTECAVAGWPDRLARSLQDSIRRGANGLKVWKDVGLRIRDESGELIFLDDHRLDQVWAVAAAAGLPILVLTADPVAFLQPLDHRNERLEELLRHPDWYFGGDEFPPLPRLLDALEGMVAAFPAIPFIGAHVGCLAEDLDWVDRMLGRYPNFNGDLAARIAELGRQPAADQGPDRGAPRPDPARHRLRTPGGRRLSALPAVPGDRRRGVRLLRPRPGAERSLADLRPRPRRRVGRPGRG